MPPRERIAGARRWADRLEAAAGPDTMREIRETLEALEERVTRGDLSTRAADRALTLLTLELYKMAMRLYGEAD